ncbi:MAG: hypothetical protein IT435_02345 [Phycisphaerales bacterium]|nr:hypothetical protein [Phycisphaerales bacterium]
MPPTRAQIVATKHANDRRRTPRIVKVESLFGGNQVRVTFDRKMDPSKTEAVFRVFLPGDNREYTLFSWADDYTMESVDWSQVNTDSLGTFGVYMSGDIRAVARFPVNNGERCDRVEAS